MSLCFSSVNSSHILTHKKIATTCWTQLLTRHGYFDQNLHYVSLWICVLRFLVNWMHELRFLCVWSEKDFMNWTRQLLRSNSASHMDPGKKKKAQQKPAMYTMTRKQFIDSHGVIEKPSRWTELDFNNKSKKCKSKIHICQCLIPAYMSNKYMEQLVQARNT